jgi:hypothetical protein
MVQLVSNGLASNGGTAAKGDGAGTRCEAHEPSSIRMATLVSEIRQSLVIQSELVDDELLTLGLLEILSSQPVVRNAMQNCATASAMAAYTTGPPDRRR